MRLSKRLRALLERHPDELAAGSRELDDLLAQTEEETGRLLLAGRFGEAEELLRLAEALTIAGRHFGTARVLRVLLGDLNASRNDHGGALAWYGAVLALPVTADDPPMRDVVLRALAGIANVHQELADQDRASAALAGLLEAAVEFERADYAWQAAAVLAGKYLSTGQFDAGLYFVEQADWWWSRYEDQSATPGLGDSLAAIMVTVARTLCYERKDYQGALRWAQRSLTIAPGKADAFRVLGFAHHQLEEYQAAVDAYRAWIAVEPAEVIARNNLAGSLALAGHDDAAVETMAEAVKLDPGNLLLRINFASTLHRLARPDAAVAALDSLIGIGRKRERTESVADSGQFRDFADYMQNGPTASQVNLALMRRAAVNFERGRTDLVAHDIEDLLARPDPVTRAVGHRYRGLVRERGNDPTGALAAYADAIETGSADTDTYADRARLLLRLGRDAQALDALEALAAPERDPRQAISRLNELLVHNPGDPRVLRVRGAAHFHADHAQAARADLKAAIDGGESDWRTFRLYGLSLLLLDVNDDLTSEIPISEALDALTQAARLSRDIIDDADAADVARILRWVLDRVFGDRSWLERQVFQAEYGAQPFWCSAIPDLLPALLAQARAGRLEQVQAWEESAAAWAETQGLFGAAGFPVTAARTSLKIADILLRLYDVEAVTTHLEIAGRVHELSGVPLTAGLGDNFVRRPGILGLELDYLRLYGIGIVEHENLVRLLRIQLSARAGDHAAAIAVINDGDWLFAGPEAADFAPGVSVRAVTGIAQVLRQAGEHSRALALLDRITATSPDNITAGVWATKATLIAADPEMQMGCLDEAERLADGDPSRLRMLAVMRAEAHVSHQRWEEAITLLDAVGAEPFQSPNTGLQIQVMRAAAELGRGNPAAAINLIGQAISEVEGTRLGLSRWELREAWSGTSVRPYQLAIRAAVAAGQPTLAFEYAERARARAFLDEMALAGAELEDLNRQIRQTRDDADWLEQQPSAVSPAEMTRLQALIRRYPENLPGQLSGVSKDQARTDLAFWVRREEHDLAKRLDLAKVKALRRQGLNPVTWEQLRTAVGCTYVAQYHVLDEQVLMFAGNGAEPEIIPVSVDLDEIHDVLSAGETTDRGFDFRQIDMSRFQSAAAPLVTPLASRVQADELICLIPHGQLHSIPLHVLEVDGEPLGLRNPISYAPSASILARPFANVMAGPPGRALVVGDPTGDLGYARVEAVTVAGQLAVTPVLGRDVSKQLVLGSLLDQGRAPGLVHLAAHGTTDTDGAGGGIVLGHSSRVSGHGLRDDVLTSKDLAGVNLPAGLIVLSCCRTADGALRPGDELIGLARAFLAAGAATVVLSQWSVNDLSTSLLMRELYRLITQTAPDTGTRTLADALRQAAAHVRSMTRDEVTTAIQERLAEAIKDPRTKRTVRVECTALASIETFASMRSALAVNTDHALRDAALEAETRRDELWTADSDLRPFKHPHYWAPFVLIGDWRLLPGTASSNTTSKAGIPTPTYNPELQGARRRTCKSTTIRALSTTQNWAICAKRCVHTNLFSIAHSRR